MGKTIGNTRHYICKCCSAKMEEPLRSWKKKSQKNKNVCPWCIEKKRVDEQTRLERLEHLSRRGYGFFNL